MSDPIERACPKCGVVAGEPCRGKRRYRLSLHRERGKRPRRYEAAPIDHLRTDSPIEHVLAGTILGWLEHHGFTAEVSTQVPIGPYRADILVTSGGRRLVVECDGAEFHCSEERVMHDKRRDRYCAAQGIFVMRFTGSEIHRDARGCAAEVGLWIRLP